MFVILVQIPNEKMLLKFKVKSYEKENGKVIFREIKAGLSKEFPDSWCAIEEIVDGDRNEVKFNK